MITHGEAEQIAQSVAARTDLQLCAYIEQQRQRELKDAARIAELEAVRRELRQLLHRMVKYVTEDRATTPGVTRLARLTEQVRDYLQRTSDPSDILRGGT